MTRHLSRALDVAMVVILLTALLAGLGVLLAGILTAGSQASEQDVHYLYRLALVGLILLCLTLLLLAAVIMRYVRHRMDRECLGRPVPYVNAWELSGRRLQLPSEDEESPEPADDDDDEPDDPDGPDGPGEPKGPADGDDHPTPNSPKA